MEHSKHLDEAFHQRIKEFICSNKFFSKLEENEHARHFYLENNVVKVSLDLTKKHQQKIGQKDQSSFLGCQ